MKFLNNNLFHFESFCILCLLSFFSLSQQQQSLIPASGANILPLNHTYGNATMTHYDLPLDYVASCGCVGRSTYYPTVAINALSFGSDIAYGPSCGQCYRLTLLSTPNSPLPPDGDGMQFSVDDPKAPSVIVKVVDSCPKGGPWCSQEWNPESRTIKSNMLGSVIHFDLAWPSKAIPKDFYPLDSIHNDYGVWWVVYELVDCKYWQGYTDPTAWGSDWSQQDAACCPTRPFLEQNASIDDTIVNLPPSIDKDAQMQTCPSYQDVHQRSTDTLIPTLTVPNTSNILSRRKDQDQTNSAISAHASLTAIQAFRNALYLGRSQQILPRQMAQKPILLPILQQMNSWQNVSLS
jgi:hypothetical protein